MLIDGMLIKKMSVSKDNLRGIHRVCSKEMEFVRISAGSNNRDSTV